MTFEAYDAYRTKLFNILRSTGWELSDAAKISIQLVKYVDRYSKCKLGTSKFDFGKIKEVSAKGTLRDFLTALGNTTFSKNEKEWNRLLQKYNTVDCIEALNVFIERVTPKDIEQQKSFFKRKRKKVDNSAEGISERAETRYETLRNSAKDDLASFRIAQSKFSAISKGILTTIGYIGNFHGDNEVTVGFIPLGSMGINSPTSVQAIEVAHSNKIVKFRAVGSIFLAHQTGGKDSIIIEGLLTGPLRITWLALLWTLALLSQGKLKLIEDEISQDIRSGYGEIIRLNKMPIDKETTIDTQKPAYERHWTFPVITGHEILTNCYVETFNFEEKLINGREVINYTLLLRTYDEPGEWINNLKDATYRQAKAPSKTQQMLKYSLNFTYRMMKWAKEYYYLDTNTWKTSNYYNVDAVDMGMAFSIAAGGIAAGGMV